MHTVLMLNFSTTGVSILVSVTLTVILMCLREGSRQAAEKEEKEEKELMEEFSSDEQLLSD